MADLAKCLGVAVASIAEVDGVSALAKVMGLTVSAEFSPSGSPVGWWPADKIIGLEDSDPVGTWPDQSGNGHDLVQATAAKKPLYKTAVQNGNPVVRCDGNDDFMAGTPGTIAQPNTIFLAGGYITTAEGDRFYTGESSIERHLFFQNNGKFSMYAGTVVNTTVVSTGFKMFTLLFNGASSTFRLNTASTATNPGTQDLRDFVLATNYGYSGDYGNIDVGEIILYNGNESPADNEAGLNTKYAIY